MRPRPDAAENLRGHRGSAARRQCFNEAAARCRGKRLTLLRIRWGTDGFNEAAARCRGKRPDTPPSPGRRPASMRPRPDAAENQAFDGIKQWGYTASMRPRPDAAENPPRHRARQPGHDHASMRPRPDAAENAHEHPAEAESGQASMRPRPDAAENSRRCARRWGKSSRFNEAAARCRGKPPACRASPNAGRTGFNEAAARCRGKLQVDRPGLHRRMTSLQ